MVAEAFRTGTEMDPILGGGFAPGNLVVVCDEHGSRIDALLYSFVAACVEDELSVLFCSTLDPVDRVFSRIKPVLERYPSRITIFDVFSRSFYEVADDRELSRAAVGLSRTEDMFVERVEREEYDAVIVKDLPFLFEDVVATGSVVGYAWRIRRIAKLRNSLAILTFVSGSLSGRDETLIANLADYLIDVEVVKTDRTLRRMMYLLRTPEPVSSEVVEYDVVGDRLVVESVRRVL